MSTQGRITAVREQRLGDTLAVAAVASATTLTVYDTADFDEDGGYLYIPGMVVAGVQVAPLAYTTIDDDLSTITLAAALSATLTTTPVDTEVQVWDVANAQPASTYLAVVDSVDGFDGTPVEATVDQGLIHAMSQFMRDGGAGESVTLERDGSELKVAAVHGRKFSLASMQYLQGGMTTRQAATDAGVDILGADPSAAAGTNPGVYLYGVGGVAGAYLDQNGISTAPTGQRMLVSSDAAGGVIQFYTGATSDVAGFINPDLLDPTGGAYPELPVVTIKGGSGNGYTTRPQIQLMPGGTGAHYTTTSQIRLTTPFGGKVSVSNQNPVTTNYIFLNGDGTMSTSDSITSMSGGLWMNDLSGGGVTTASINGSGRVIRTVSSRRYKSNIKPLKLAEARKVLDLEPVTFTLKDEARTDNRHTYPGVIAEQAADVGLDLWVGRNREGEPDSFRYAELTVPLLMLVREQAQQIADLTTRIESLEKEK